MKNKLIKTICIFTSICLIFPAPVRAAQGTPRIPNDAISIYLTWEGTFADTVNKLDKIYRRKGYIIIFFRIFQL